MAEKKKREEKIRELEEKIKKLEEQQGSIRGRPPETPRGGVAGGVLRGLGGVIPGLGKMLEGLEDSEAFQERLDAINKEVDKRFRETPLKRVEGGTQGRTTMPKRESIPGRSPLRSERGISLGLGSLRVDRDFSIRTLASDREEPSFEVKAEKRKTVRERAASPQPAKEKVEKEILVDIFEEDEHLRIIAELPGVEEKDIKVELKEDSLTISADTPYRKYYQEVTLPCLVKGAPETSYKNGVLEIELEKES